MKKIRQMWAGLKQIIPPSTGTIKGKRISSGNFVFHLQM